MMSEMCQPLEQNIYGYFVHTNGARTTDNKLPLVKSRLIGVKL